MAVELIRFYHRTVSSLSLLLNTQSGHESTNDSNLGYKMFGYKDISGSIHRFMDKGQPIQTNRIQPVADSTSSLKITKADGSTVLVSVDSSNERIGIGKTDPAVTLDVNGQVACDGMTFRADGGVDIPFINTSTDPTGQKIARLLFKANNEVAAQVNYSSIETGVISTEVDTGTSFMKLCVSRPSGELATGIYIKSINDAGPYVGVGTTDADVPFTMNINGDIATGGNKGAIYTQANSISAGFTNETNGFELFINNYSAGATASYYRNLSIMDGKLSRVLLVEGEKHTVTIGKTGQNDGAGLLTLRSDPSILSTFQICENVGNDTADSGTFNRSTTTGCFRRADAGLLVDGSKIKIVSFDGVFKTGYGFVWLSGGDSYEVNRAFFTWDYSGVEIIGASGAVKNTDLVGNLCVFIDSDWSVAVKNRLGSDMNFGYSVFYFENTEIVA